MLRAGNGIFIVVLMTLNVFAWADPQVSNVGDFIHAIKDPENAGIEVEQGGATVTVDKDDLGRIIGHGRVIKSAPCGIIGIGPINPLVVSGDESAAVCTVTDTGGNQFITSEWESTILKEGIGDCLYTMDVVCWGAIAK